MLSKAVKLRRRINREYRRMPAWRRCMRTYKQHQIVHLKVQRNGSYGARGAISPVEVKDLHKNLEATRKLQHERQHMTREEWLAEFAAIKDQRRVNSFADWARLIAESRVEFEDEVMKSRRRRKH